MKYLHLLSNRKWRIKCKRILKRDRYKCTACGGASNLQVHHTFYYSDYPDPWTYPDNTLITVCRDCHKQYHEYSELEIRDRGKKIKKKKAPKPKKKKKLRVPCLAEIQSREPKYKPRIR